MITPRFSLKQDDKYLFINIRAPYCNIKELEIYVEHNDFRFVCAPYYLRLTLPGSIIDGDSSSGEFKHDEGIFLLKYLKEHAGEHFEGLDFLTSLLTQRKTKKNLDIEVLSTKSDDDDEEWSIDQTIPTKNSEILNSSTYGFADQKSQVFSNFENEFYSVFDLRDVDKTPLNERKLLKTDTESLDFNEDHFIADYFDDSGIQEIIGKTSPWLGLNNTINFSDSERDFLKDLPNKEYLLSKNELNSVLMGLLDILFAFCYDKRTNDFENNCESGWNITKLSSTLSWFYTYDNERSVLISNYRRSLIYPLYRHFLLSKRIHEDLIVLLNLGQLFIIKCLIDVYNIFASDSRYILNDLYIKDYIIFMQKCPKHELNKIVETVNSIKIDENDVNLNINNLIQNQIKINTEENILEKMAKLNITKIETNNSDEDSDTTTTTSDDDDDDDDTSSDSNESE